MTKWKTIPLGLSTSRPLIFTAAKKLARTALDFRFGAGETRDAPKPSACTATLPCWARTRPCLSSSAFLRRGQYCSVRVTAGVWSPICCPDKGTTVGALVTQIWDFFPVVKTVYDQKLLVRRPLRDAAALGEATWGAMGATCIHLRCTFSLSESRFPRSATTSAAQWIHTLLLLPLQDKVTVQNGPIFKFFPASTGPHSIWTPVSSAKSLQASQPQVVITQATPASRPRGRFIAVGCLCSTDRIMRVRVLPQNECSHSG